MTIELKGFEAGDAVTILRGGQPSEMTYIDRIEDGVLFLENGTLWTPSGAPISAEMRGARLSYASPKHSDNIEKAKTIGRVKEIMSYLSGYKRLYYVRESQLLAIERALAQIVAESMAKLAGVEKIGHELTKTTQRDLEAFAHRLQAAERAEVMHLSTRERNR